MLADSFNLWLLQSFLPLSLSALASKEIFMYLLLFLSGAINPSKMRLSKNTHRNPHLEFYLIFLLAKVTLNTEKVGS